ncbi:MAG: nicotinamide mononucleotide adenylyltransferase [Rickettsiales bacterium]|jgi:nicotinamide mononucleotide adenylyltransferase
MKQVIEKKYTILIGRRQPAHQGHLDCVLDAVESGAIPVIFLGSANDSKNFYYDPISNPLTPKQLTQQMEFIAEKEGLKDFKIIELADFGNPQLWVRAVVDLLKKHFPQENLNQFSFHFFPKENQKKNSNKNIKTLDFYVDAFEKYAIKSLIFAGHEESKNLNSADFRIKNVNSENFGKIKGKNKIPYRSQIINLANQARTENQQRGFTQILKNIDVTMFDLSLNRLIKECGLTMEILNDLSENKEIFTLNELIVLLKKVKT